MTDRTNETDDIELIEELVFSPCGLMIVKIPEEPGKQKTPDFQIISWRGRAGFCELKSPRDDWLDEQLEQAQAGQIVGSARPDPTFNRIARHIQNAVAQFDTVNPNREWPNVLVFVNHADASTPSDLYETITGHFPAEDGSRPATMTHISLGRLRGIQARIDLCIWIDRRKRAIEKLLFMKDAVPNHTAALKELFRQIRFNPDEPSAAT